MTKMEVLLNYSLKSKCVVKKIQWVEWGGTYQSIKCVSSTQSLVDQILLPFWLYFFFFYFLWHNQIAEHANACYAMELSSFVGILVSSFLRLSQFTWMWCLINKLLRNVQNSVHEIFFYLKSMKDENLFLNVSYYFFLFLFFFLLAGCYFWVIKNCEKKKVLWWAINVDCIVNITEIWENPSIIKNFSPLKKYKSTRKRKKMSQFYIHGSAL